MMMYSMMCVWWAVLVMTLGGRGLAREPRPMCPPDAENCVVSNEENNNPYFVINGIRFKYEFTDGELFAFECPRGINLDEPGLPRFKPALQVREVRLTCPPPAASYEAALSALNVTALEVSSHDTTEAPPTYSIILKLDGVRNFNSKVLAATPTLRELSLSNTELTLDDLAGLPASLQYLDLDDTKINFVPAEVLKRLPALVELRAKHFISMKVEPVGNLSSLTIVSSSTLVSLSLPDSLKWLHLSDWALVHPDPWRSCAGLESLDIYQSDAETLPDGWLARCGRLHTLVVETADKLNTLPAGVLRLATALEVIVFSYCALEALPVGLFDDARALRKLNVEYNFLHTLPGDLFRPAQFLSSLNLNGNYLSESVLDILGAVTSLNVLRLDGNPALDACPCTQDHENTTMLGSSALRNLKNLSVLSLSETATTRICPDWRQLSRLQVLNLYGTNTTRLKYTDLWFNNTVTINVGLDSMNLSLRREDYDIVAAAETKPSLILDLIEPLRCDCKLYWAAAALRRPGTVPSEQGGRCEDGRPFYYVPLEEFVCPAPGRCPAGCSCTVREDIALPERVLQLDCAGGELTSMPDIDTGPESFAVDLRLARNRIRRLSPDDLPPGLLRLDLRNNSLGLIENATALAMVSRVDRRVLLAGNPLECDCRAAAALATMRGHPDIFPDWADATCSNGTALSLAMPLPCEEVHVSQSEGSGMSGGAVAALVLGVVAAAALASLLGWPSLRRRLRVMPSQLPPATYTGEWLYDVFVSFAHVDEAIVHELVERLEGGAEPFRLCVHYRDWMPGGWIPAQIAASVRVSRRTVAVVSEAFLRSKWARAELRQAYAAAAESTEPRLILVFLEDPSRLSLGAELREYVAGNTYVCWGDTWFWQKLRRALPDPLPRQSAESTAHATPNPTGDAPASPLVDSDIELASIYQNEAVRDPCGFSCDLSESRYSMSYKPGQKY